MRDSSEGAWGRAMGHTRGRVARVHKRQEWRCAIMGDGGCEGDSDRGVRGTAVGVCRAEGDNNGQ